jgi:osmoprotectant transport system permease protein
MTTSRSTLLRCAFAAGLLLLLLRAGIWEQLLAPLFPELTSLVYDRTSFENLLLQHAFLVFVSSFLATLVGVTLGILVTRHGGRDFLPVVNAAVSVGQTFPPVAVLALAVPAVGFGAAPTIIALFLYGLLPVVRNTVSGIQSVPLYLREAASGMGMTGRQVLSRIELRLALPVIMAGIRTSVIINIGTATLGATIGAGGLGAPIIAGLVGQNPAYVLQGAILAGLFAILVDTMLEGIEERLG